MDSRLVKRNMIATILLQIVTMICGFVIPQVTLRCFGSEVNGLCNSISQFLNVIALLEGGATSVVSANLYKPIINNGVKKINGVVAASNKFFKSLSFIFAVYAVVLGLVYPLLKNVPFNYEYVVALIWTIGFSTFIQYAYAFSYRILLRAGQRVYIVSYIQIIFNILNAVSIVVIANSTKNVLLSRIGSSVVFLIQPVLLSYFANRYFPLQKDAKPDETALSQRWDSFGQNIAYYIHSNTDIVILTIFSTFLEISVYTVHSGIISAIRGVTMSISTAFAPTLGSVLAGTDEQKKRDIFSIYTFIVWVITTVIFCTTIVMIEPFIAIYTEGINDVDYFKYLFAVFLTCAEAVYCLRDPYISAIYSSGHFKQTTKSAYFEAGLNILISLLLVKKFGIEGVAFGTLLGMTYRMIYSAVYVNNTLIKNTIGMFRKTSLALLCLILVNIVIGSFANSLIISTYLQWMLVSCGVVLLNAVFVGALSITLFKTTAKRAIHNLRRKS